ncbi:MAG: 3-oxoacyl-[acyl-carrier-protein] reductase [Oscillospiraceae bacterium]|nr:3-oxoacyl-[acyl-carrier-protein] reductase [Oscillospiraceae bacterium]
MFDLKGKVAIVTGGSQGIGKVTCLKLAELGADMVINYYPGCQDDAEQVKKECEAFGVKAMTIAGDVSKMEDCEAMFHAVQESFGKVDILVNNAGITRDALMVRMKESDFDAVINVNLKGTWNCMKLAAKIMMKQRSGKIISLSSVAGVAGNAGQSNYSASKAGIIGMTKTLAKEIGSRGVNVNAVAPGMIETDMTANLPQDIKDSVAKQIPMARYGKPEEIANVIAFLASDAASYVTGQVINIDGGLIG